MIERVVQSNNVVNVIEKVEGNMKKNRSFQKEKGHEMCEDLLM